jgi:hypothetical protein
MWLLRTHAQVIRYSWYALKDISGAPFALTWCRYTFFYVLYPLGVTVGTCVYVCVCVCVYVCVCVCVCV